jgi:hypothetical protein
MLYLTHSQYYRIYLSVTRASEGNVKANKEKGQVTEKRGQVNPGNVGV